MGVGQKKARSNRGIAGLFAGEKRSYLPPDNLPRQQFARAALKGVDREWFGQHLHTRL
jgi:hypothetical protein